MTIFILGTILYLLICFLVATLCRIISKRSSFPLKNLVIRTRNIFFVCLALIFGMMFVVVSFYPENWVYPLDKLWDHTFYIAYLVSFLFLLKESRKLKNRDDRRLVIAFCTGSVFAIVVGLIGSFW